MSDHDAPYMLVSWAKPFTAALLDICVKMQKRRLPSSVLCKAGEIATRLQMACPYIESLPPYWIEPDVEQLGCDMLKQLVAICMVSSVQSFPDRHTWVPAN